MPRVLKEAVDGFKLKTLEDVRLALDNDIPVYMGGTGPFGGGNSRVIDTKVGSMSYPGSEDLDAEGLSVDEWHETYDGTPAVVIEDDIGQSDSNTQFLDAYGVDDFDIYIEDQDVAEFNTLKGNGSGKIYVDFTNTGYIEDGVLRIVPSEKDGTAFTVSWVDEGGNTVAMKEIDVGEVGEIAITDLSDSL